MMVSGFETGTVDTLACLRAAPLEAMYSVEDTTGSAWAPVIDGDFIRQRPAAELAAGNVAHVPILLGSNSDEELFVVNTLGFSPNSAAALTALLINVFPAIKSAVIDAILTAYPEGGPEPRYSLSPDNPWCAALAAPISRVTSSTAARLPSWATTSRTRPAATWRASGRVWGCPRTRSASTRTRPRFQSSTGTDSDPALALHGAELAYEFGLPGGFTTSIKFYPPVKDVPMHRYLSHVMVSKWVAFAHEGDPNAVTVPYAPYWPPYGQFVSNMDFNATDNTLNIHVEPDTYREEGINI